MSANLPSLDAWTRALQSGERTRLAALVAQDPKGLERVYCWPNKSAPAEIPLCWALLQGRWALTKVLLELGADPNARLDNALGGCPFQLLVNQAAEHCKRAEDGRWPTAVLDLAETLLEKGADPHVTQNDQDEPALEICLSHAAENSSKPINGKRPFDPTPKNVALAIWRSTGKAPWPPRVRWRVWKVALEQDLQAWQDRLNSEGILPHDGDEGRVPSLAAEVCRTLTDQPEEKRKALLRMGAMGLRWRANWSDEEASTYLASCQVHRLQQRFSTAPEASGHRKERL